MESNIAFVPSCGTECILSNCIQVKEVEDVVYDLSLRDLLPKDASIGKDEDME
jgi:hypothetical protein